MNATPAAVFVAAIIGALLLLGTLALVATWVDHFYPAIVTWFRRSEWQELDDHERAQAALRHPSAGGE